MIHHQPPKGFLILISIFFIICHGCTQPVTGGYPKALKAVELGAWSLEAYLPLLQNKQIALVVNHTSLIGETHLVDTLISQGIKIGKLFAPEHGFRGGADAGATIRDQVDEKTGIPVISLYGNKKKPSSEDLAGIEMLVFDIQDVGARFYTYISTLHYIMEAAAENGIPLIVLDRPNPNGHYVDGPVLDTAFRSFVGMHPIPVVYGMTIGELAQMINGEGWIKSKCELTVIPCKNYDHNTMYELPVRPSPNLPNLRSILLYPSLCFFEGTDVSVGRGTQMQFQVVGHPKFWVGSFAFTPTPQPGAMDPPWNGITCYGKSFANENVDSLFAKRKMDLNILLGFYEVLKRPDFFNASFFDKLSGSADLRLQIEKGMSEEQIRESWEEELNVFLSKRVKYLLYDDFEN